MVNMDNSKHRINVESMYEENAKLMKVNNHIKKNITRVRLNIHGHIIH